MTTSIEREHLATPRADFVHAETRPRRLVRGVQVFTAAAALAGVSCLTVAWCLDHVRAAIIGATLIILAAIAGAVWIADVLIADRRSFYERGKADGWYEGWRGVAPDADDPFLRH